MNRVRNTEQGKAEATLDKYFSLMIRERDKDKPCIACGKYHREYEAGHYRRRELGNTRWDYRNVNGEGKGCNGGHVTKYGIKDMDLYRENLDARWGKGTADALYALSKHGVPDKQWTLDEINLLKDAARRGFPIYKQVYDEVMSLK